MLTPKEAWQATLGQMQLQLNRATFDTWLKGAELVTHEDGEFVVRVRHAYAKDWLEKHLQPQIAQTLGTIADRSVKLNFVVTPPVKLNDSQPVGPIFAALPQPESADTTPATPDSKPTRQETVQPAAPATPAQTDQVAGQNAAGLADKSVDETAVQAAAELVNASAGGPEDTPAASEPAPSTPAQAPVKTPVAVEALAVTSQTQAESKDQPQATPRTDYSEWDPRVSDVHSTPSVEPAAAAPFNPDYTFDTFVSGPSNQFAQAAAKAVAAAPGKKYNPLFLHGGVGLGKTHLLHAIGQACQAKGRRVLYVTAEMFTNDTVAAIRGHTTEELRARYRTADVLLVDDIQFIAGKTSTEEEFYHTFNAIVGHGGQIVLAGNQSPNQMTKLDDRLRSRFEGGLMADIQTPEVETRLAILRIKSTARGTALPEDVASILAHHATQNVRELEGLLTQILARATLTGQPLTVALAEQVVNRSTPQPHRHAVDLNDVLEATATYHQLSLDDLMSKRRTKDVVRARQIAMYLARELTEASFPQIGAAMGGRNHTTVLHGYQKIADTLGSDQTLQHDLSDLRRKIQMYPNN